ncbi:DUF4331 family protein [Algivirga pacifica]|uniref:PKD domain-containing protein n=1 Tax=Algivirga pacifica TaxID=1162670 RepID=A0ABP9D0U6_9BACT
MQEYNRQIRLNSIFLNVLKVFMGSVLLSCAMQNETEMPGNEKLTQKARIQQEGPLEVGMTASFTVTLPESKEDVKYFWKVRNPDRTAVRLSTPDSVTAVFVIEQAGDYEVSVTIFEGDSSYHLQYKEEATQPVYVTVHRAAHPLIGDLTTLLNKSEGHMGDVQKTSEVIKLWQNYAGVESATYVNALGMGNGTLARNLGRGRMKVNKWQETDYAQLNGRKPTDDVVDVLLQLMLGGEDPSKVNIKYRGLMSDKVDKNDASFLQEFPYFPAPH